MFKNILLCEELPQASIKVSKIPFKIYFYRCIYLDFFQSFSLADFIPISIIPIFFLRIPAATTQCIQFNNTNYSGDLLYFIFGIPSANACCDLCTRQTGCNVYVYCPRFGGCDDGSGRIYPGSLCSLKYQRLGAGTGASAYGSGPNVPWTSGIVTSTSLGYCIGYASAAASAQATAGCGSVAYAVAVATAVDSCGNTAAAQALSVAVGGKCPVTCESAIQSLRSAATTNGCGSPQYTDAVNTASALCGASRYAQLSAGICPAPDCGTAVAQASASASAGCDSIAYASALATAQTACASAFASAAATAIGGKCPIDCPAAISAASAAAKASGCNSTAFASAQATGILICGAESYASAAAVSGGVCTIGKAPAVDDKPVPASELPLRPTLAPVAEAKTTPGAEIPVVLFPSTSAPQVGRPQLVIIPGVLPNAPPTVEPTLALLAAPSVEPRAERVTQQPIILPVNVPAPESERILRGPSQGSGATVGAAPTPETITTIAAGVLPVAIQTPVTAPTAEIGIANITQSGAVNVPPSTTPPAPERITRAPAPAPEQGAAAAGTTTATAGAIGTASNATPPAPERQSSGGAVASPPPPPSGSSGAALAPTRERSG